eukprot:6414057-Lingulodinium_polyedra.AAC.1
MWRALVRGIAVGCGRAEIAVEHLVVLLTVREAGWPRAAACHFAPARGAGSPPDAPVVCDAHVASPL